MLSSKRAVMTFGIILLAVLVGVGWGTAVGVLSSPAPSSASSTTLPSPTSGVPDVIPTSVLVGSLSTLATFPPVMTPVASSTLPVPSPGTGAESRTPTVSRPTQDHTTPTAPFPTTADLVTYVVEEGDTLSGIAARFGTTVDSLRRINNLNGDTLRVGDELRVPMGTNVTVTPLPTSTSTATPTPTLPLTNTPVATARPVDSPSPTPAGTVRRPYAPPRLVAPEDGAGGTMPITLKWTWEGELGEDEYFDVRVWRPGQPHYGIAWTKTSQYVLNVATFQGLYFWSVAIVRGESGAWLADLSEEAPARRLTVVVPGQRDESEIPVRPQPTPTR